MTYINMIQWVDDCVERWYRGLGMKGQRRARFGVAMYERRLGLASYNPPKRHSYADGRRYSS